MAVLAGMPLDSGTVEAENLLRRGGERWVHGFIHFGHFIHCIHFIHFGHFIHSQSTLNPHHPLKSLEERVQRPRRESAPSQCPTSASAPAPSTPAGCVCTPRARGVRAQPRSTGRGVWHTSRDLDGRGLRTAVSGGGAGRPAARTRHPPPSRAGRCPRWCGGCPWGARRVETWRVESCWVRTVGLGDWTCRVEQRLLYSV